MVTSVELMSCEVFLNNPNTFSQYMLHQPKTKLYLFIPKIFRILQLLMSGWLVGLSPVDHSWANKLCRSLVSKIKTMLRSGVQCLVVVVVVRLLLTTVYRTREVRAIREFVQGKL